MQVTYMRRGRNGASPLFVKLAVGKTASACFGGNLG